MSLLSSCPLSWSGWVEKGWGLSVFTLTSEPSCGLEVSPDTVDVLVSSVVPSFSVFWWWWSCLSLSAVVPDFRFSVAASSLNFSRGYQRLKNNDSFSSYLSYFSFLGLSYVHFVGNTYHWINYRFVITQRELLNHIQNWSILVLFPPFQD